MVMVTCHWAACLAHDASKRDSWSGTDAGLNTRRPSAAFIVRTSTKTTDPSRQGKFSSLASAHARAIDEPAPQEPRVLDEISSSEPRLVVNAIQPAQIPSIDPARVIVHGTRGLMQEAAAGKPHTLPSSGAQRKEEAFLQRRSHADDHDLRFDLEQVLDCLLY